MLEKKTDMGYIRFSKSVIERIIDDAVSACNGNIILQNYKGKYKSVIPGSEEISIKEFDDGVHIQVYVVIRFGASIRKNTCIMSDYIKNRLLEVMGEEPALIRIIITGIQSKGISRRHIEITHCRQ